MHIYLNDKTVILKTDSGVAKWQLESVKLAQELFDLLISSEEMEQRIAELCEDSL